MIGPLIVAGIIEQFSKGNDGRGLVSQNPGVRLFDLEATEIQMATWRLYFGIAGRAYSSRGFTNALYLVWPKQPRPGSPQNYL